MASNHTWQVQDPSLQIRRHWDGPDEWVVFNAASGDIHLLNAAAIAILDRLRASPASPSELCAVFDPADSGKVEAALQLLDRLGLIHPVSS